MSKHEVFSKSETLLGKRAMRILAAAKVLVCGMGAVGSYTVEALARGGIGALRLVDPDKIELSNINRQLYALHSTLGEAKTDTARKRILDINPDCKVETIQDAVASESISQIASERLSAVIDCMDSPRAKVELLLRSLELEIPTIVTVSGAATRLDPRKITVGDLFKSSHCPLAKQIRKALRRILQISGDKTLPSHISCVYSLEEPRNEQCSELGSFSCLPGIFGLTAAQHAVANILSHPIST